MRKEWGETPIPYRVAQRAATRYEPAGACHISTYSVASHGYAQVGWNGREGHGCTTAQRAAWVYFNGKQIRPGFTIDHKCKNRRCVRREHLRELSNLENARRTLGRDWELGTCLHGHGPEHWKPKCEKRLKGYCAECRRIMRLRNIENSACPR